MTRRLALLFAFVVTFLASREASAAKISVSASARQIELGDVVSITLAVNLSSQDETVSNCKLFIPGSFRGAGPQMGQQSTINISGGQMVRSTAITCTWSLEAKSVGKFTLGPASVWVKGVEEHGEPITITVVPQGSAPRQPFDPFRDLLRDMQRDFDPQQPEEPQVPLDPNLALETAPDSVAFLHATLQVGGAPPTPPTAPSSLDKKSAVVGEQVTLDVYLYLDATLSREPDISDLHEPGTSDFVRENLLSPQMDSEAVGYARAGTRIFAVRRVRRYALFPLTTGHLKITPMKLTVGRGGLRMSEALEVTVTEPPVAGRPAGYTVGDVGTMTLAATVAPRTAPRGGAIGVTVTLAGSGNLPTSLVPPARPGVEWLTPEVQSSMKGTSGVWGGTRTFTFVVRPTKEGTLDLGSLVVPYWDAGAGAYAVARADLGSIDVTKGAASDDDAQKVLTDMPTVRSAFAPPKSRRHFADSAYFVPALFAPTALFGLLVLGTRVRERRRRASAERAASPETELKEKLAALDSAMRGTDARELDAQAMRVVEAAALVGLGLNVRGIGQERIEDACVDAGASKEDARKLRDLLDECAAARFAPGDAPQESARERGKRAKTLAASLRKGKS